MYDSSSYVNPTRLAHADTSRNVLPRGGTSQGVQHAGHMWPTRTSQGCQSTQAPKARQATDTNGEPKSSRMPRALQAGLADDSLLV
ncbi:hypothetical protein TNCV_265571 [Trichonephila clavipes]|nr:hypothetical protein TNCV_265571 [Trichonephila clavipes]